HGSKSLALGFQRVLDQRTGDAEFGDGMSSGGGRRSAVERRREIRVEDRLQVRFHLADVRRHVHAVGRALEPDLVLAHLLSISASTRSGLPLPLRILSGAATTMAPVGGS